MPVVPESIKTGDFVTDHIHVRLSSAHEQPYQQQLQTVVALARELLAYTTTHNMAYIAPPEYSAVVYALFTHEHSSLIENGPFLEACIGGPPIMCAREKLTTWVDKALLTLALSPKFHSHDGRRRAQLALRFADWITEHPAPEPLTKEQALRLYSVALPAFVERKNVYMRPHANVYRIVAPDDRPASLANPRAAFRIFGTSLRARSLLHAAASEV